MSVSKDSVVKGVFWSFADKFASQGVQFIIGLLIARILAPSDFGLIAMISIFIAIAQTVIDSGFASALIQKQDRTEADYNTVFCFNLISSLLLYAVLYVVAPFIASFYKEPQLENIIKVINLCLVINAISIIKQTKLTIDLNFKPLAVISVIAVFCGGGVALVMAKRGFGVWALVAQQITSSSVKTILFWITTCGRSNEKTSLKFDKESFRSLFSFGSKLLLSGILHTIYLNLYSLVIGKRYQAADVGFYTRATSISQFVVINLMTVFGKVFYPAQCKIQNDEERLKASFRQYMTISCFVIFPLSAIFAALAYPVIELVLTEKWLPAAPLLQILCIAYMFYPIMYVNNNIITVKGRTDYFLKAEIVKKTIAIVILLATLSLGLRWLCWGLVAYSVVDVIIIIYYTRKVIDIGYLAQLKMTLPMFVISAISGVVAWSATVMFTGQWVQILSGTLAGIGIYVLLAYCVGGKLSLKK